MKTATRLLPAFLFVGACQHGRPAGDDYLAWLESRSMLHGAGALAPAYSGRGTMWRHPYAESQPRAASALASVWFTAYPAATITGDGQSVLAVLGDEQLWTAFKEIGITGMHTGPMKQSGAIRDRAYTPTIDGNFDRIAQEIDPAFGSEAEYLQLTANARRAGGIVIGDVIPGHTGKGADFRLAERAFKDYPGIYHIVEIERADWVLLSPVPSGKDSVNLSPTTVDQLKTKGYLVGRLPRTIFYQPGVKESDFSATDVVRGADGKERRWVYLHYFKDGQPTLNWLDPSFAAARLVIGDALHSLGKLGESMLRLDANGFLGIEARPDGTVCSEGHPLSVTSNQLIAGMVRKLGGFTFQELNLTLEDLTKMSQGGADLSYDFVTRPAYHHALTTGDTEFLRLMLGLMRRHRIDPASLIHALQNHDELTLELVHFWTAHRDERFRFRGQNLSGGALRDLVRNEMHDRLVEQAPYNLKASNGISCTTASLVAAALGVKNLDALTQAERRDIQAGHLLAAMYNALQPGVFALSGWDLVGALTLPADSVKALIADGDTRWVNRGAYDLLGKNPAKTASASQLPRTQALYGSLPEQLADPSSFASRLKKILAVRREYRIHESEQIDVPEVKSKGLLVMVHRLPADRGIEVTALNFDRQPIDELVVVQGARPGKIEDLLTGKQAGEVDRSGKLRIRLAPFDGQAILLSQ